MIIKKLKINNIRSYLNQEINLPEGSVLLAGDIGTGKSSLLLSIEFALFGLQKGELTGPALLRNGKNNGAVELHLKINDKDIIIHRELKRTKTGINQENCYIIIDNEKKQLTPLELKQIIIRILNYPKESLTRKPIIYRYTVYTPQEQMKHILFDNDETRIDSIRKIFNLDKYGRIKSNSKIITDKLKEKINKMEGIVVNLDETTKRKNQKEIYKEELNKKIKNLVQPLSDLKTEINNLKESIEKTEKNIILLNTLKRDYEVLETELKYVLQKKQENIIKLKEIENKLNPIPEFNVKEKEEKKSFLNNTEDELKELVKKLSELNIYIKKSQEIINKIINLNKCPICEQEIPSSHKENIKNREDRNIKEIKLKLDDYAEKERECKNNLIKIKTEMEELQKKEREILILKSEQIINRELKKTITEEQEIIENSLDNMEKRKPEIHEKLKKLINIEDSYNSLKTCLDNLLKKERELEIQNASLNSELTTLEKEIISLEKEIKHQQEIKEKINYYIKLRTWLTDTFTTMIETIEKNVMTKLNYDFNTIFEKWFNRIIEDENIQIKIDENFSPLITQNNHDINYEYLSGGEKTAIALSYRLALNQVINSVMSNLNTKDLIILDEPTDGFSSEQLDRVRTVLNELNAKQIILVSHESKIESFVDNVIRFNKKEHISCVY